MPSINTNDIKVSETHIQKVTTPVGTHRITLGQLRGLVAATEHWPDSTPLEIVQHEIYGAAPTLILQRDLLAADQATKEN